MKNNVIEIRNGYGFPVQVEAPKAQPLEGRELKRMFLWSMVASAIAGALLVLLVQNVVDAWR